MPPLLYMARAMLATNQRKLILMQEAGSSYSQLHISAKQLPPFQPANLFSHPLAGNTVAVATIGVDAARHSAVAENWLGGACIHRLLAVLAIPTVQYCTLL